MFSHDKGDEPTPDVPDWVFPWVIPIGLTIVGLATLLLVWTGVLH